MKRLASAVRRCYLQGVCRLIPLSASDVPDYDQVAGIRLPTKHRIFPRTPDGQSLAEPLIVSIDLSEITFAWAEPTELRLGR